MVVLINRRPPRSTRTDTLCPDTRPFRSAIAPIGDERPPLAIGHRAAGEGMRRQKRGKARTFTVECKAVARMSDIHDAFGARSEEPTSELQSLMRSSYAVFCLKKKNRLLTSIGDNKNPTTTLTSTNP